MKTGAVLLLVLLLAGCITKKETYLIIANPDKAYIPLQHKRDTTYTNRFEKQFIEADSVFTTRLSKLLNKNRNEKKLKKPISKKLLSYVSAEQMSFGRMCELINKDIEEEKVKAYNQAIDDVYNLIENHEEEVYIGVINDILNLNK